MLIYGIFNVGYYIKITVVCVLKKATSDHLPQRR